MNKATMNKEQVTELQSRELEKSAHLCEDANVDVLPTLKRADSQVLG